MKRAVSGVFATLALAAAAGSAFAADLPARVPIYSPPPVVPIYSWSGFYIGLQFGWGTGRKEWTQTAPAAVLPNTTTFDADGIFGGGQFGFNWQTSNIVFGVEIDLAGSDLSGNASQTGNPSWQSLTDINWFGSVSGRLGYAWDRVLIYAKGGFAFADESHHQSFTTGGSPTQVSTVDNVHTGFIVGGGIEFGMWDNWTGKVEYNYVDLGPEDLVFSNSPPGSTVGGRATDNWTIEQRFHMVKFGLNYRWGGWR